MSKNKGLFVENVERKSWDEAEYARKAAERRAGATRTESQAVVVRDLKRHGDLALTKDLGTRIKFTDASDKSSRGGFYCKECDRLFHDSLSYVEHINSPQHLAKVGMRSRALKSSLSDVRARLEHHKEKAQQETEMAPSAKAFDREWEERKREAQRENKRRKRLGEGEGEGVEEEGKAKGPRIRRTFEEYEVKRKPRFGAPPGVAKKVKKLTEAEMMAQMGFATSFTTTKQ